MRSVYAKFSSHALVRAIVYIVLGVLMILFPQTVSGIVVYILAAYVAILGIINIVNYIRCRECRQVGFDLVSGILMLVLGIVMAIFAVQIVTVLPIFLGVLVIIGAASGLVQAVRYGRLAGKRNIFLIVLDALLIVGGLVVILNPFQSAILLLRIFGGIIIVLGIAEVISFIMYRKSAV